MTDHTVDHNAASGVSRKHRQEGPKNHVLVFALSILLTAFSFLAVAYALAEDTHVERWFVLCFIIGLALFQAIVQLGFWMHMKDKGHEVIRIFIIMGFVIAITGVLSAMLWTWW